MGASLVLVEDWNDVHVEEVVRCLWWRRGKGRRARQLEQEREVPRG